MVWLRTLDDLPRMEATISARFPHLTIVDRATCLHTVKQLDGGGRSIGHVAPDPEIFVWS
ncbi:hypothetical protein [Nonomuraea sp. B19D2]|uniref:hypothetical protein n=1 Tax=Nonomuraea sp. B19D2 TaxID=3159561 RepID=UPI0032DAF7AF